MSTFFTILRHLIKYGILLLLVLIFFAHAVVRNESEGYVYTERRALPQTPVAVVLGTSRYTRGGSPNPFFVARMDAAAELVIDGTVSVVIVSGDNSHASYNEPAAMREALEERGVASARIVEDYAGFRTLDSVVRTARVFGQDRFIVVSQRFHVERAVFVARARSIDAVGYVARDASGLVNTSVRLREYLARVRAMLDVYLLATQPRFLGEPVPIEFPEESTLQS